MAAGRVSTRLGLWGADRGRRCRRRIRGDGAAWLAGMRAGLYPGRAAFGGALAPGRRFGPRPDEARREEGYAGWREAARRTLSTG